MPDRDKAREYFQTALRIDRNALDTYLRITEQEVGICHEVKAVLKQEIELYKLSSNDKPLFECKIC